MIVIRLNNQDIKEEMGIVLEEFDIEIPEPKRVLVDVPGREGQLDMSETVTGYVTYHNRHIHLQLGIVGEEGTCEEIRNRFFYQFHTKEIQLEFSHLRGYFKGRLYVEKVTRQHYHYTLLVKVICEPYRYVDTKIKVIHLTSVPKTEYFFNLMMHSTPTLQSSGNATIEFENKRYVVRAGQHRLGIVFKPGTNLLKVSGTGTLTVSYVVGVL